MAYKKKMTPRRRRTTKGVPKKIKTYVKREVKKPRNLYYLDNEIIEAPVNAGEMLFEDRTFNHQTFISNTLGEDKVLSSGVKFQYYIYNTSTTTTMFARVLVLEILAGQGYTNYKATTAGSNIAATSTELFETGISSSTQTNNVDRATNATTHRNMYYRINKEAYKVHKDFIVKLGTSTDDARDCVRGSLWIPFKRIVSYDRSGGGYAIKNNNLIFCVIPGEAPLDPALPPNQDLECSVYTTWYFRA